MYNQPTPDSKNQFELEKQLHEQYAINNNAKVSSFVSFIVALFALFGFYGYIFAHSGNLFSPDMSGRFYNNGEYSLEIFFLVASVVSLILFFLLKLSLSLSITQRSDQIVIAKIRKDHYGDKYDKFFKNYDPYGKNWFNFVQNYFNLFYWLFFAGLIFVFLTSFIKVVMNICYADDGKWTWWGILIIIVILLIYNLIRHSLIERCNDYQKYMKRCDDNYQYSCCRCSLYDCIKSCLCKNPICK